MDDLLAVGGSLTFILGVAVVFQGRQGRGVVPQLCGVLSVLGINW